jgi:hypothetical protein
MPVLLPPTPHDSPPDCGESMPLLLSVCDVPAGTVRLAWVATIVTDLAATQSTNPVSERHLALLQFHWCICGWGHLGQLCMAQPGTICCPPALPQKPRGLFLCGMCVARGAARGLCLCSLLVSLLDCFRWAVRVSHAAPSCASALFAWRHTHMPRGSTHVSLSLPTTHNPLLVRDTRLD